MPRIFAFLLVLLSTTAGFASGMNGARPITVYYFDRSPYYTTETGQPEGFLLHLATSILRAAKIDFELQELPAPRILEAIRKSREPAVSVGWFKTADRELFARFSLPIYQDMPFRALFLKSGKRPPPGASTFEAMSFRDDITLGVIDTFSYGSVADKAISAMSSPPVRVSGTQEQLVRMLAARRFDYMLVNPEETATLARQAGLSRDDLIEVPLEDLPRGNFRYLMFNAAVDEQTVQAVNTVIKRLVCTD